MRAFLSLASLLAVALLIALGLACAPTGSEDGAEDSDLEALRQQIDRMEQRIIDLQNSEYWERTVREECGPEPPGYVPGDEDLPISEHEAWSICVERLREEREERELEYQEDLERALEGLYESTR